jgi:hypothetical protein
MDPFVSVMCALRVGIAITSSTYPVATTGIQRCRRIYWRFVVPTFILIQVLAGSLVKLVTGQVDDDGNVFVDRNVYLLVPFIDMCIAGECE